MVRKLPYAVRMLILLVGMAVMIFSMIVTFAQFEASERIQDSYYYFDLDLEYGRFAEKAAIDALEEIGVMDSLCSGFERFALKTWFLFLLPGLALALIFLIDMLKFGWLMKKDNEPDNDADDEYDEEEYSDEDYSEEHDDDDTVEDEPFYLRLINYFSEIWRQFDAKVNGKSGDDRARHTVEIEVTPKIFCPDCGTECAPGAKFCKNCGRQM